MFDVLHKDRPTLSEGSDAFNKVPCNTFFVNLTYSNLTAIGARESESTIPLVNDRYKTAKFKINLRYFFLSKNIVIIFTERGEIKLNSVFVTTK